MNMMRACLILMAMLAMTGPWISPSRADELAGTWLHENGNLRVRFGPCGGDTCGTIVWVNPDSKSTAKVGERLFYDMRPDGKNSWTGKAATNGSVYVGKLSLEGANLRTSGCIMNGVFCRTVNWTREP